MVKSENNARYSAKLSWAEEFKIPLTYNITQYAFVDCIPTQLAVSLNFLTTSSHELGLRIHCYWDLEISQLFNKEKKDTSRSVGLSSYNSSRNLITFFLKEKLNAWRLMGEWGSWKPSCGTPLHPFSYTTLLLSFWIATINRISP